MAIMSHDQFVKQYGRSPSAVPIQNAALPQSQPQQSLGEKIGGGLSAVFGGNQIGKSLVQAGTNIGNLVTGGVSKFENGLDQGNRVDVPALAGDYLKAGSNFIPGVAEGAGFLGKTAVGAATGYAMDVGNKLANNEKNAFTPGLGTVIGGGLPAAGAVTRPAAQVLGRLFKGLGSGLSGASAKNLEAILENPKAAQKASALISQSGGTKLLENNARTIVNGVSQVRQGARAEFGKAMQSLGEADINPQAFRQSIQPVLDKFGVASEDGTRSFDNAEFSDPKNIQKASALVSELSTTKLDGKSLHTLMNKVDDAKYKTATSDERLSFNAFLKDLHSGIKDSVSSATDKLGEANKNYANDMGLAEATENTFGKVKYKNFPEVVKASKKLEGLFQQKGLEPEVVDKFLTKIGIDPSQMRASEAVRQIGQKESGANATGLSLGEVTRAATSAVLTPEMVGKLTVATGMTREKLAPFLRALKTPARNVVIQALLQDQANNQKQGTPAQ